MSAYNIQELSKIFQTLWTNLHDIDIAINCVLVYGGIRRSYLFQPDKYEDDEIPAVIHKIRELDCFKLTDIYQGILIYNKTDEIDFDTDDYTCAELGKFLGYVCTGDIINKRNYVFRIYAEYDDESENIYTMICGEIKKELETFFDNVKKLMSMIDAKIKVTMEIEKIYEYTASLKHMQLHVFRMSFLDKIEKIFGAKHQKASLKSIENHRFS